MNIYIVYNASISVNRENCPTTLKNFQANNGPLSNKSCGIKACYPILIVAIFTLHKSDVFSLVSDHTM